MVSVKFISEKSSQQLISPRSAYQARSEGLAVFSDLTYTVSGLFFAGRRWSPVTVGTGRRQESASGAPRGTGCVHNQGSVGTDRNLPVMYYTKLVVTVWPRAQPTHHDILRIWI